MQQVPAFQSQQSSFRQHVANQLNPLGTSQIFEAMELVSEVSSNLEGSVDTMKDAR
jgi:hypothetical protein